MLVDDIVKEFIFESQVQNYIPRTIKGHKTKFYLRGIKEMTNIVLIFLNILSKI